MKRILVIIPGALLLLSACSNKSSISPDFGNAVRHNKTVHIINPRTPNPAAEAPYFSGARALGVMERYRTGEVKELRIEKTSKKGSKE